MDGPARGKIAFPLKVALVSVAVCVGLLALFAMWRFARPSQRPSTVTPDMDRDPRFWVRVLLFDSISEFSLSAQNGFAVSDAAAGPAGAFEKTAQTVSIAPDRGIIVGDRTFGPDIEILPAEPYVVGLNERAWRGNLRLTLNSDGQSLRAINSVPLEGYLAGVVGEEMPSYWEPEALKAQAVAARTYALFIKHRFGANRAWDVRRTQANQVYGGLYSESPMVWDAVRQTRGLVLVCDQPEGEKIFPAYYSSTCGGHTENSANVFGDSYPSLTGVACPHCREVTRRSFFEWSSPPFQAEQVSSAITDRYAHLRILHTIVAIEPNALSDYEDFSRVATLSLTGSNGRKRKIRAEDFRLTVDPSGTKIRSSSYRIEFRNGAYVFLDGRGFGHAVGMCQYGAEGMARKNADFREILNFYYPSSALRSIQ